MNQISSSVQIQSILYNNNLDNTERLIESMRASYRNALSKNRVSRVIYTLGDCSPEPLVKNPEEWESRLSSEGFDVKYNFFNANLGHGGGHNKLNETSRSDLLVIVNPDVVVSPNLLDILASELEDNTVGMAEANQVPFEHPKAYDLKTRETSFSSGCCFMIRQSLYEEVDGIDHENFFMYCDDVDLSWRIRLKGKRLIFAPDACVYHDHRLTKEGSLEVGAAEFYYSALGGLILAHKWNRIDIVDQYLKHMRENPDYSDVIKEYDELKQKGKLPTPIEGAERVSLFSSTGYADYRWTN